MNGFRDGLVGRLLSKFVTLDRDNNGLLDRSELRAAIEDADMPEEILAEVQDVLATASNGKNVNYNDLFESLITSGWRPEIELPSSIFDGDSKKS